MAVFDIFDHSELEPTLLWSHSSVNLCLIKPVTGALVWFLSTRKIRFCFPTDPNNALKKGFSKSGYLLHCTSSYSWLWMRLIFKRIYSLVSFFCSLASLGGCDSRHHFRFCPLLYKQTDLTHISTWSSLTVFSIPFFLLSYCFSFVAIALLFVQLILSKHSFPSYWLNSTGSTCNLTRLQSSHSNHWKDFSVFLDFITYFAFLWFHYVFWFSFLV